MLVWGAVLRTVVVWHITWSVNSVTHVWGYRNYNTPDVSRNNALIALLASGEGWHNNHHADSRSARHGHKWYEIDLTWLAIRLLMLLGLAKNVALPSPILAAKFNTGDRPHAADEAASAIGQRPAGAGPQAGRRPQRHAERVELIRHDRLRAQSGRTPVAPRPMTGSRPRAASGDDRRIPLSFGETVHVAYSVCIHRAGSWPGLRNGRRIGTGAGRPAEDDCSQTRRSRSRTAPTPCRSPLSTTTRRSRDTASISARRWWLRCERQLKVRAIEIEWVPVTTQIALRRRRQRPGRHRMRRQHGDARTHEAGRLLELLSSSKAPGVAVNASAAVNKLQDLVGQEDRGDRGHQQRKGDEAKN